jgi:phosphate:Na+ symporter
VETIHILTAGVTAIILFVFGLENFSAEIERISGERFRRFLSRATNVPLIGVLIGALVTAVIQSSSATSVIAISLVNAGVLSFKNSVGIIFGANVGTTVTAQLVAFKLTAFAPLLIIIGFALSLMRSRVSIFGKSIFYFGFVFFSLNLISSALQPLQSEPALVNYLVQPQNPLLAILIGCLFTAVVQSSSVTTGLAIIFTQQGILGLENAVPLIMGANIGTTATALIAMFNMDLAAKKTALSHFLFNVGGVLLFLPLLLLFGDRLNAIETDPAIALANIHLVFNVATSLLFVLLLTPFTRLVEALMGEGKMDFERLPLPVFNAEAGFDEVKSGLEDNLARLLAFLQENYNLVTLSIESNYRSVLDVAARRIDYVAFLEKEHLSYFSRVVANVGDETESRQLLALVTRYDYLFQIHDSIEDLFNAKRTMIRHYIELKSDVLLMVRELSSQTLALFDDIRRSLDEDRATEVEEASKRLQVLLTEVDRSLLPLLADQDRRDAGALSNFVTYSRRLRDKLVTFAGLSVPRLGGPDGSLGAEVDHRAEVDEQYQ